MASALLGSLQFGLGLLGGVILHTLPFDQLTAIAVMMAVLIGAGALAVWVHSQRQTKLSVL